ncbi:hypothetical protein [Parvularcula dongshanensis]|uniref:Imelysin-like domain-containing protein n=1 Tax=Parvularcula dongshanensis TaxID=1173995 RepID=A0A840I7R4_9PROT|nr:hypothetical protein [Parvularcula dongshanensis]MBB4660148.1 hypothetical protein [Parvularcula dongshanensis]
MGRLVLHTVLMGAALGACALNAARLEAGHEVAERSNYALAAAHAYFDAIEARRTEAAAALVASDPSCLPISPLVIQIPAAPLPPSGAAPLCVGEDGPAPGYEAFPITLGASPRAVLAPRIELLTAIADYAGALAAILDAPKTDVSALLADAAAKLEETRRFANFVGGSDLPSPADAVSGNQGQALLALFAFVEDLAREGRDADRVRALVEERGAVVDEALTLLEAQVRDWARGSASTADDLYGNALFRTYDRYREDMTPQAREALAARIFAARAAAAEGPLRAAAVADAIGLVEEAQAELRALLDEPSEAVRQAAARRNLDRVLTALGLVANLANPL